MHQRNKSCWFYLRKQKQKLNIVARLVKLYFEFLAICYTSREQKQIAADYASKQRYQLKTKQNEKTKTIGYKFLIQYFPGSSWKERTNMATTTHKVTICGFLDGSFLNINLS